MNNWVLLRSTVGVACCCLAILALSERNALGVVIHDEDFSANDGGYTVANTGGPVGPWVYSSGTWLANGSDNNAAPSHSRLTSPAIAIPISGSVALSFEHRYSFESGLWDAGAVFTSVNGGAFQQVPNASFSQNGYTGIGLIGNHDLNGGEGFNGNSPGYGTPSLITSVASLGSLNAGDTLQVQFLGAWDEFAKGTEPNWELHSVQVNAIPEPTALGIERSSYWARRAVDDDASESEPLRGPTPSEFLPGPRPLCSIPTRAIARADDMRLAISPSKHESAGSAFRSGLTQALPAFG